MWSELQKEWVPKVDRAMEEILTEFAPTGSTLVEMANFHLSTGGKRLRALLPIAVAYANQVPGETMLPFAAACELLHNATLVHDDLQDGDKTRRGEPAIWVKYGSPQAINLGDALLYFAIGAVTKIPNVSDTQKQAVISRFVSDTLQVIDGQEREFALQQERCSLDDYFRMVEGKTSGLFALPFAGAAELCGADQTTLSRIEKASRHLGVVFQIQDDVLDIFADKGRERRGSDIAEGKRSALAVYALENASTEESAWLLAVLDSDRDDVSDEQIGTATGLFRSSGALQFALDEIDRRCAQISTLLEDEPTYRPIADALVSAFLEPIKSVTL